jgi:hypothetical protein
LKKLILIRTILFFIILSGIFIYFQWFQKPLHKSISRNDIESIQIYGINTAITLVDDAVLIDKLIKWFNNSSDIRPNKNFEGTTPESGIIINLKSGKGMKYREIPLNATCRQIISDYLEYRKSKGIKSPYLITTERSAKACRSSINKILKKHGNKIGFPEISPHVARRYFLTKVLEVSDISTAMELAGHSSVQTTIQYVQSTEKRKQDAVTKITNDID